MLLMAAQNFAAQDGTLLLAFAAVESSVQQMLVRVSLQ